MLKRHSQLTLLMLRVTDLVVVAASWGAGYLLRILGGKIGLTPHATPPFGEFIVPMCFSLILAVLAYAKFRLYEPRRTKRVVTELADVAKAVVSVWAITYVVISFMSKVKVSRLMMASVLAAWLALAMLSRLCIRAMLRSFRRRGWNQRSAAIIGTGRLGQKLFHALRHNIWTGIQCKYFVGDPAKRAELLGCEVRGPLDRVDEILNGQPVDIAFVAIPGQDHHQVTDVLNRLAKLNVDVRVVPDLLSFHFFRQDVTQLDDIPIISMTHSPQHGWQSLLKRSFDIFASVVGLIFTAVPMLIIALLIKLSGKGPVFYSQVRTSVGGKPFRMIKFRTMRPDAEADTGPVTTTPDDRRVTKIGRFLRRTSLDELPQLFNILAGQMSLVGPRPERPELIERLRHQLPRYMLRHQVKAGLTGWAQVHGLRGQSSLRKRVQYDLHYITNWSFGLDLRICFLTLFRGFVNPNAY